MKITRGNRYTCLGLPILYTITPGIHTAAAGCLRLPSPWELMDTNISAEHKLRGDDA